MYTEGTMNRTTNLLISSNVQYAHLGGDNQQLRGILTKYW